jgi:formylglycine-generating enzyme required for sulfatase activity
MMFEWIDIPAGSVTLENVSGTFEVAPFRIAKYPITNAQFGEFIEDVGYKDERWWDDLAHRVPSPRASDWKEPDSPKLEVCWYEAVAFTRWMSDRSGLAVRLPTEWEWQWAAVGDSGWTYPYGDGFDAEKCNCKESGIERTSSVLRYDDVKTHFGVVDMAGNVWEWCLNEGVIPDNVQITGSENRALRGGSWKNTGASATARYPANRAARTRAFNTGFRVMVEV